MLKTFAIIEDQSAGVGDPGLAVGRADQAPNGRLAGLSVYLFFDVAEKNIPKAESEGFAGLGRELRLPVSADSTRLDDHLGGGKLS